MIARTESCNEWPASFSSSSHLRKSRPYISQVHLTIGRPLDCISACDELPVAGNHLAMREISMRQIASSRGCVGDGNDVRRSWWTSTWTKSNETAVTISRDGISRDIVSVCYISRDGLDAEKRRLQAVDDDVLFPDEPEVTVRGASVFSLISGTREFWSFYFFRASSCYTTIVTQPYGFSEAHPVFAIAPFGSRGRTTDA